MKQFKATVIENIPANRLLNLAGSGSVDDRDTDTIYLQVGKLGSIPDLVTYENLEEGTETNVRIADNPIWQVEASQDLHAGTLVMCDDDGRVKFYNSNDGNYIGFTIHAAQEGEVVSIVRKSGMMLDNQIETMSMKTKQKKK